MQSTTEPNVLKFQTVPREVLAMQWTGTAFQAEAIKTWFRRSGRRVNIISNLDRTAPSPLSSRDGLVLLVETRAGMVPVSVGDYIYAIPGRCFETMPQTLFETTHKQ